MSNCSATLFTEDDNNEYVWHGGGYMNTEIEELKRTRLYLQERNAELQEKLHKQEEAIRLFKNQLENINHSLARAIENFKRQAL